MVVYKMLRVSCNFLSRKLAFPAVDTVVSLLGHARFLLWKLAFLYEETDASFNPSCTLLYSCRNIPFG